MSTLYTKTALVRNVKVFKILCSCVTFVGLFNKC